MRDLRIDNLVDSPVFLGAKSIFEIEKIAGRGDTERLYFLRSSRFDLSALLMLPVSPDSLALRATIGLSDPLGLALPVRCLPLPRLSLRRTQRAFSRYRAVLGTRSLHIPVIALLLVFYNSSLLLSPVEWDEGCWEL